MAFKGVRRFYWSVGCSCFLLFLLSSLLGVGFSALGGGFPNTLFVLDYVGLFLRLTSLILLVSLFGWWGVLTPSCRGMLLVSVGMSFLCYNSLNVFTFWVSYELCILPLLFLLVRESSYSERFIAFWYLAGYVVLTRLPFLLSLFYLYGSWGGLRLCLSEAGWNTWLAVFVLCVCFITKIPLPPFHV